MRKPSLESLQTTGESGSNLARAFFCLERQRKYDIICLYAFFRLMDDIADATSLNATEQSAIIREWQELIESEDGHRLEKTGLENKFILPQLHSQFP